MTFTSGEQVVLKLDEQSLADPGLRCFDGLGGIFIRTVSDEFALVDVGGVRYVLSQSWLRPIGYVTISGTIQAPTECDGSKWQDWVEAKPGYCACGIARTDCEYHR